MIRFINVDASNVAQLWPTVRKYLLKVTERGDKPTLPEDVYVALIRNECAVTVGFVDDRPIGAFAVRVRHTDARKPELWVWAAGSEPGLPVEVRDATQLEMFRQARAVGAKALSMSSPRAGWSRMLQHHGWKPVTTIYAIEVPDGQP